MFSAINQLYKSDKCLISSIKIIIFIYNKYTISMNTTKKLSIEDVRQLASAYNLEAALIMAVQKVETAGRGGFLSDDRPIILFEGHIFWSQLKKIGKDPATYALGNEDILYPKWTKQHYKGGVGEYTRLNRAIQIDRGAALRSASWGMFQIMGFNYRMCSEASVENFVCKMQQTELIQLQLFMEYIRNSSLLPVLANKDWKTFASKYNGPGYALNKYDQKLAKAYLECGAL